MTVVLDDTPANEPGMPFTNTAKWQFSRWIDLDEDGLIDSNEFFNPLPGESGISAPMTIVAPNLVVNKTSKTTALNVGDRRPSPSMSRTAAAAMPGTPRSSTSSPPACASTTPPPRSAPRSSRPTAPRLVMTLTPDTDYTVTYSGCELTLTMLTTPRPRSRPSST